MMQTIAWQAQQAQQAQQQQQFCVSYIFFRGFDLFLFCIDAGTHDFDHQSSHDGFDVATFNQRMIFRNKITREIHKPNKSTEQPHQPTNQVDF